MSEFLRREVSARSLLKEGSMPGKDLKGRGYVARMKSLDRFMTGYKVFKGLCGDKLLSRACVTSNMQCTDPIMTET